MYKSVQSFGEVQRHNAPSFKNEDSVPKLNSHFSDVRREFNRHITPVPATAFGNDNYRYMSHIRDLWRLIKCVIGVVKAHAKKKKNHQATISTK